MTFLAVTNGNSVTRTVFWRAQGAALVLLIVAAEGASEFWPPITFALILTVGAAELLLIILRLRDAGASAWLILIPCAAVALPAPAGLWYAAATTEKTQNLGIFCHRSWA